MGAVFLSWLWRWAAENLRAWVGSLVAVAGVWGKVVHCGGDG